MEQYEIKITGSGTRAEIIAALLKVIDGVAVIHNEQATWEDHILVTEIKTA